MSEPSSKPAPSVTYEGGFEAVVKRMQARQEPLSFAKGEALPALNTKLAPLKSKLVQELAPEEIPRLKDQSGNMRKSIELNAEFVDLPEICKLHGLLIAHLRKSDQPKHTMALFTRLWAEEADFLIAHLDPRWLVSAITTFGDHGENEVQRRLGQSMTVLFAAMKLYESERLYSGFAPEQEFKLKRLTKRKLPLNMDRFALVSGGLDINMLAKLWVDAQDDAVVMPLAHRLLNMLNDDPGTVFRRLKTLRGRKERQIFANKLLERERLAALPGHLPRTAAFVARQTWSVVSTIKAAPEQINLFIEHHARLGAEHLHIFLDAPVPEGSLAHWSDDLVTFTLCDDAYWKDHPRAGRRKHQTRQAFNANKTYRSIKTDWLTHIDVDEFIHPHRALTDILAAQPQDRMSLVMPPAEELSTQENSSEKLFRRTYFDANIEKTLLYELYPSFGRYIKSGFISHTVGKTIARRGNRNARFGVHFLKPKGEPKYDHYREQEINILHRHASDWPSFARHLDYRMSHGSYRSRKADKMGLGELIEILREEEGADGPKLLFDEICRARPEVVKFFEEHQMLIRARIPTIESVE